MSFKDKETQNQNAINALFLFFKTLFLLAILCVVIVTDMNILWKIYIKQRQATNKSNQNEKHQELLLSLKQQGSHDVMVSPFSFRHHHHTIQYEKKIFFFFIWVCFVFTRQKYTQNDDENKISTSSSSSSIVAHKTMNTLGTNIKNKYNLI